MKMKRIVRDLLAAAIVYAALTFIIAGGFAMSMGFAWAATPNAQVLANVHENSPSFLSPDHALVLADSAKSNAGK
jgi:hypothetical protein